MLNEQEQTVVLEAREILGRYLSRNPVIGSWQAVYESMPTSRIHKVVLASLAF